MRALASHKCGPGSNPSVDSICGLSLLLVLCLAPRGFSPGTPIFPLQKKTRHFQIPVTPVMVVKRFSIFFFANGRITFIKFEGCFVKGQIRPNGFKIPKCCIVKCLNFTVPFEKKIENLFFSESVLIGQSSSKRPGFSARTVSHCLWLFNL